MADGIALSRMDDGVVLVAEWCGVGPLRVLLSACGPL
jgi:hypothetical protein